MAILSPGNKDYGFYNNYIQLATAAYDELFYALEDNRAQINNFFSSLSNEQLLFRYEAGKWSIKEVLQHFIDSERQFCYRIMRISRKEQTPIPGFDIHNFIINSGADSRDTDIMLQELELLRKASILMFNGMTEDILERTGFARDVEISVRALGFAMVGHTMHHIQLINEKYMPAFKTAVAEN